eukprot:gb/GECH01012926.1/.p1 GENE.gb/GECH01012926.1/~~gb/GECH01012926.1/.p1  ORF type:complete len:136 (+),score=24.45 gb/GECH01012926.1/:1-408(+)
MSFISIHMPHSSASGHRSRFLFHLPTPDILPTPLSFSLTNLVRVPSLLRHIFHSFLLSPSRRHHQQHQPHRRSHASSSLLSFIAVLALVTFLLCFRSLYLSRRSRARRVDAVSRAWQQIRPRSIPAPMDASPPLP